MSNPSSAPDRLRELERIIAQTTSAVASNHGAEDPVAVHLADVPVARIRELTRVLQTRPIDANDDIDALAMRLLLNDYIAAIGHLRAVARAAASLVDGAAPTVTESQQFLRDEDRARAPRDADPQ